MTTKKFPAITGRADDQDSARWLKMRMKQGPISDSGVRAPQYFEAIANSQSLSLPVNVTASDVREAVRLLKREPEGITAGRANNAYCKRLFASRKVAALAYWGIVSRDEDRIKLSSLGWEFANRMAAEAEAYRVILRTTMPYDRALVWILEEKLKLVTPLEIGRFWIEQYPEALGATGEEKIKSCAASFFHICHGAEIGIFTVGRKGQPTHLLVYDEELRAYLGESISHMH